MLTSYRRVLAEPGTLRFSAAGLVARLPLSMVGLGIVLLVVAAKGTYGLAGAVAAAYTLSNACLAIVQGRLVDRLGQARVLIATACAFLVAMVALIAAVETDWPLWSVYLLAAVAGATLPQIGSCVRARWSWVLSDPRSVQTAYAIEAVADEAVFIIGPILVAVLAALWDPVAGLAVAITACVGGTLALSLQRATEPPPHPHHRAANLPPMPWRVVLLLAVVSANLGLLFGAAEVATVGFADEQGSPAWAGGLLALWACGSLLAGVLTGARTWHTGPEYRVRWGSLGMFCAMVPLYFVDSIATMGAILFVGGFAVAPTLIGTLSLTAQVVPAARLTEGMAFIQTGLVAGVAPGATVAGFVIDARGASTAYLVCAAAGAVATLAARWLRHPSRDGEARAA